MKERITDLMEFIPLHLLDKLEVESPVMSGKKISWQRKALIPIACCIAIVLCSCIGLTILKPNLLIGIVRNEKLEEELVGDDYYTVKNDNYCLTVETVIADINVQYILVSVEALSDEAKSSFDNMQASYIFSFSGDSGVNYSFSEYSILNKGYKKYYVSHNTKLSEEGSMRYQVGLLKEGYEDVSAVFKVYHHMLEQENLTDLIDVDEEILSRYYKKAIEKTTELSIPIRVEVMDKKITIIPTKNTFSMENKIDNIIVRRLSISVVGTAIGYKEGELSMPTIIYRYKDGSEQVILKNSKDYINKWGDNVLGISGVMQMDDNGKYTYVHSYPYAIDIEDIDAVIIDGLEYEG